MQITVNGQMHEVDVAPDMPLLWVLRDELNITGPKFGCGIAMCGACTVHIDGTPVRACSYPISAVRGEVTTIEGLGTPSEGLGTPSEGLGTPSEGLGTPSEGLGTPSEGLGTPPSLHAVQAAWIEHQVAQCGYCQSGQIMSAAALIANNPAPSDTDIDIAMSGNLCRCGTYPRIRAAVKAAAANVREIQMTPESNTQNNASATGNEGEA